MTQQYILYTTSGCHLCDQALLLWQQCMPDEPLQLIDIADDDTLFERYGVRIPVIQSLTSEQELAWPFEVQDIDQFVKQQEGGV